MKKKKFNKEWENRFYLFWRKGLKKESLNMGTVRGFIKKELKRQRNNILKEVKVHCSNNNKQI